MKVFVRTFGCRANQYDSEVLRATLEAGGATLVQEPDGADVAIYNSCAVTRDAVADLRQDVRRTARLAPGVRQVITGCAAAVEAAELAALPRVSDVIGGSEPAVIAAALGLRPVAGRPGRQGGARALLRIQDGCDEHCTFCATTLARGAHRSRPAAELIEEASRLAEHHAEVVLTGIHIGHWGREAGESLGTLVQALVRQVPQVRFRLTSVEATEVDGALKECFAEPARLAPHLHAPLQSGSDAVLRRMGRHWYTAASYAAAIEALASGRHPFALGADVMTGFPGETDADHAATMALVRDLPFTYLHVFPWSPRPGTAALRLARGVPPAVARERAAELRALGEARAAAYRAGRAGTLADLVVVRRGAAGPEALSEDYLSVRVVGEIARGERLAARLVAAPDGSLQAHPDSA